MRKAVRNDFRPPKELLMYKDVAAIQAIVGHNHIQDNCIHGLQPKQKIGSKSQVTRVCDS